MRKSKSTLPERRRPNPNPRRRRWHRWRPCKRPNEGTMESAIPPHLQVARTRHRRVPDDYQPPYPAFVARHQPAVEKVVMAYFGLQYRGDPPAAHATALDWTTKTFAAASGPKHWDRAQYVDEAGYTNLLSVAYWDDQNSFDSWFSPAREAWTGAKNNFAGLGTFIEV